MTAMSFDRAADFYDATRSFPPGIQARLTAMLAAEVTPRGRCLEIGVGTGRIALPLVAAGVPLAGVDIASKMLRRLVENADGNEAPLLCVADVTALPFGSHRFGAVLACHVLHLIDDWRAAVDEAVRVLHRGGVLLVDFGGAPLAPWSTVADAVMKDRGIVRIRPGMSDPGPVADHLSGRAVARALPAFTMTVERTLAQDLSDWEGQIHSWTWSQDPGAIAEACAGMRRWASDNGWPLERRVALERTIQWWAFDLVG
ncbi:MAG TPA: class I SAM-dependent methyltransferase [Acidimicrobiales bacterium]|nr:class I SAM-dependent methyltransferase [Acidimicrobiales bacterium]